RESSAERQDTIASLRQKLARCITGLPQDAAYAGLRDGTMIDRDHGRILESIRNALRHSRALRIDYLRPGDHDAGERTIRPYALLFHHGAWYLGAHCERAGAMRLFRAERIVECTLTDASFDVPPEFTIAQLMV